MQAVAAGGFTTLAKALTAADLIATLKGPGPFTVFAPTDAAFAALPAATLADLLKASRPAPCAPARIAPKPRRRRRLPCGSRRTRRSWWRC